MYYFILIASSILNDIYIHILLNYSLLQFYHFMYFNMLWITTNNIWCGTVSHRTLLVF